METFLPHKVGIYQITEISKDDAFYEDRETLVGMCFTFPNNSVLYTYPNDSWTGIEPGVSLLIHKEHSSYNFLGHVQVNFFEFKYRRVM